RLNANGSIDPGFTDPGAPAPLPNTTRLEQAAFISGQDVIIGGNGFRTTGLGTNSLFARALKLGDGSADNGFGDDGVATIVIDPAIESVQVNSIAPTADGGVLFLVVQARGQGTSNPVSSLVMYKLDAGGALDSTFGNAGQKIVLAANGNTTIKAAVDP